MVFTSLAIRPTSFDRLAKQLERATPSTQGASAEEAYWIRRGGLCLWGRRLPWRAKCFEQGVAAAHMLKRRGKAYEVHYGAANTARPMALAAHVWVTSAGLPVVGHENASDFSTLATFRG